APDHSLLKRLVESAGSGPRPARDDRAVGAARGNSAVRGFPRADSPADARRSRSLDPYLVVPAPRPILAAPGGAVRRVSLDPAAYRHNCQASGPRTGRSPPLRTSTAPPGCRGGVFPQGGPND